jgi:hypothetical protein
MSTTSYDAPPPTGTHRARGSVGAVVVGTTLVVIGFLTAISGAVLLALFNTGSAVSSGQHSVSTPTSALVTDLDMISTVTHAGPIITTPVLHLTASGTAGTPVFVGIGPSDRVAKYLDGVAVDHVRDLDLSPFSLITDRQAGDAPATPPAAQDFWVAAAQSSSVTDLTWQIRDGSYAVVIMNADGSVEVASMVEVGVSLPGSTALWLAVLFVGVGFVVVGGIVIAVGTIRR